MEGYESSDDYGLLKDDAGPLGVLFFAKKSTIPPDICDICSKFQILTKSNGFREDHEIRIAYNDSLPSYPSMTKRAHAGCMFCKFIRISLGQQPHRRIWQEEQTVDIILTGSIYEGKFDEYPPLINGKKNPYVLTCRVLTEDYGWEEPFLKYDIEFQLSSEATITTNYPLSVTNVQNISRWIRECEENHPSCIISLIPYSPTRLLAVKDEILRIVEPGAENTRYAAMSYCWGRMTKEQHRHLTTNENINRRMSGFAIDELPRTLRDAVQAARALHIDYLWIDAICIIQNNTEDFQREAPKMGTIYSRAYFTIAATNSSSSSDGFLHKRNETFRADLGFTFTDFKSKRWQAKGSQRGTIHFRYPAENRVKDHFSKCSWEERGWTLQEKLLSTRILYFTKDVLYFECGTSQRIENGYEFPWRLQLPLQIAGSRVLAPSEISDERESYLSSWYRVVRLFSMRKLTHPRDKLPAIEGLAAKLKDLIDDTYVFGLWKDDLYRGLLWHSGYGLAWKRPRGGYRAPSWSWASGDGLVSWDESILKPGWTSLLKISNITHPQRCSHCEQQRGAELELMAPTASLKEILAIDAETHGWDFVENGVLPLSEEFENLGSFEIDDDHELPYLAADIEMVLIAEKTATGNYQALLIRPSDNPNHYERIGWYMTKQTIGMISEEDCEEREFEAMLPMFKNQTRIIV